MLTLGQQVLMIGGRDNAMSSPATPGLIAMQESANHAWKIVTALDLVDASGQVIASAAGVSGFGSMMLVVILIGSLCGIMIAAIIITVLVRRYRRIRRQRQELTLDNLKYRFSDDDQFPRSSTVIASDEELILRHHVAPMATAPRLRSDTDGTILSGGVVAGPSSQGGGGGGLQVPQPVRKSMFGRRSTPGLILF